MTVKILRGDCRAMLRTLPDQSVHCCVTSPPYWGLRDYGVDGQIGLEQSLDDWLRELVDVFREVRRVLRDDGTVWLNLGDSYAGSWGAQSREHAGKHAPNVSAMSANQVKAAQRRSSGTGSLTGTPGLKAKDLIGQPWRAAFALQADGWVLRQEIVWSKPNPMPESIRDRCTKAHESLFLLSKAKWQGPAPGRFHHICDEDARWLALLVDAEGCIVVKRCKHEGRGDTFAPQVSIGNTSEALMREVVRIVGHGSLLERPGKNCRMLYWQVANGIARDFLHRIYPFLIVKQRQARIGIYVDSLTYARGGKTPERKQRGAAETALLESLWARNKECNSFGQPDLSDVPEPQFGRWGAGDSYYYDFAAMQEPVAPATVARLAQNVAAQEGSHRAHAGGKTNGTMKAVGRSARDSFKRENSKRAVVHPGQSVGTHRPGRDESDYPLGTRNRRSVWTIATEPFKEAHFATYPTELVRPCIEAGCPSMVCPHCGSPWRAITERIESGHDGSKYGDRVVAASGGALGGGTAKSTLGSSNGAGVGRRVVKGHDQACECEAHAPVAGVVLDPFGGSGTTGLVADRLGRDAILIELNPEYAAMAERRIAADKMNAAKRTPTLFAEAAA